jgi:hypothetical protein
MVLVNSTKPRRHFQRARWNFGNLVLLAVVVFGRPVYGQDLKPLEGEPAEDRLSLAEEELAYAAKSPTERVAVFLKIADRKMEAAKKLRKTGSMEDIASCLRGYSSALQGAVTAVAWGEDVGTNMQSQTTAIRKAMRRHADILNKLENTSTSGPRPAILQVRAALANAETSQPLR